MESVPERDEEAYLSASEGTDSDSFADIRSSYQPVRKKKPPKSKSLPSYLAHPPGQSTPAAPPPPLTIDGSKAPQPPPRAPAPPKHGYQNVDFNPPTPGPLAHPGTRNAIKINPKDLKLERKKLKRPEEIIKQVEIDRLELFDNYKKYNYMPLVDSREYLRTLRAEITSITFDGIEQLNDAFLFSLHHCNLNIETLKWISLAGCYNITDEGIYWISLAFKKMHTIQLFGCRQITEKSLYYLLKDGRKMENIYMDGTSCAVVPQHFIITCEYMYSKKKAKDNTLKKLGNHFQKLETDKAKMTGCKVSVSGCPLISPLLSEIQIQTNAHRSKFRKMVILAPETLPCSPLAVLTNQKDISPSHGLIMQSDWTPFKDLNISNDHSSAEKINVFQITKNKGITELILSPGSIVVLPYVLHPNLPDTLHLELATTISTILTKYGDCSYVLLGMARDTDTPDYTQTVQEVLVKVQNKLKEWISRLKNNLRISIHTNWRMAALDHQEQEVLSFGERLVKEGKSLFTETHKYKSTKKPMFTAVSSYVTYGKDKSLKAADLQFLADIMEADQTHFPWNREQLQGTKVRDYCSNLKTTPETLTPLADLSTKDIDDHLSPGEGHMQMSKVMKYADIWGQALYFPNLPEKPVVTDFTSLSEIINTLLFSTAPRSCDLRCLGDKIPCWTFDDLSSVWKGASKEKVNTLICLLEKNGCLFKMSIDPWSSLKDVSYVYVLYKDLPHKPTVSLDTFWPDIPTSVQPIQRDKYYFSCPGIPESFFPNLLRHAMRLGGTTLLWRDGVVIQKGYLTILIEKIPEFEGLPVIFLGVRTLRISEERDKSQWATLKLYACIIDYLIMKYKICLAKSVPCVKCAPKSRYEILGSKEMRRFFLEHLVRMGDERDVACKHCDAASIADSQIGPAIKLSSLVPGHDKRGKALPTSVSLNRCLMCENCAVEGQDCPVNLKQGIRNWYCGCNREGKLCDHCGMCQRCFLYIKKIVSVVEPKFEAPESLRYEQDQIQALDEVKITKKGSILGFIAENSEVKLEKSILTPNYCPNMLITIVKEGSFCLDLTMEKPDKTELQYTSQDGTLLKNGEVVVTKARRCGTGQTIRIALSYIQGGFTEMKLSVLWNDVELFSMTTEAQEVTVSLSNRMSKGIFLQVETPEKFTKEHVKCPQKTISLYDFICSEEMRMWSLLESIEETCFGGRGMSLSGAACVSLPSHITLDKMKHPTLYTFDKINYHHMCLSWNPIDGKKRSHIHRFKKRDGMRMAEETQYEVGEFHDNILSVWKMTRLVHLLDAEGIPAVDIQTVDSKAAFMFWIWHFVLASYAEMLLPRENTKLFPPGVYTPDRENQIKDGLHRLIRMGFWRCFSNITMTQLNQIFKPVRKNERIKGVEFLSTKHIIVTYALVFQDLLQAHMDKSGLRRTYSKFNSSLELYMCPGHVHCLRNKERLQEIEPELYGNYAPFLSFLDLSNNQITELPDEFFPSLPNLVDLKLVTNFIPEIPANIVNCKKLTQLQMTENDLLDLPKELMMLPELTVLLVGNNRFDEFPEVIQQLLSLHKLGISHMMLQELPDEIGNLANLESLFMNGNCFKQLPPSFTKLTKLKDITIDGVPWAMMTSSKAMSYNGFEGFLSQNKVDRWLTANSKDKLDLFRSFDENSNGVLELKELGNLSAVVFNLFPRFGYKGKNPPVDSTPHGFPMDLLQCTNMTSLHLRYQGFTKVPPEICHLTQLTDLDLRYNPNLLSIPAEISRIETLKKLELDDCPLLKTPPREIRDKGFQSVFAYLQRLLSGAILSKRTKLMMVGLGGAGKTSLVKALLSNKGQAKLKQGEDITDGIDINTWNVKHHEDEITYNIWDFAGQTVYYNTHQFFLSTNRAIYVLLWNVRLGYEHAGLDFWLSSISVQAPKAPIFVVGSHKDQVNKIEIPVEEMQQRYPQIAGFHFISSYTGDGIKEFKEHLFTVTLQQQYMGEHIPGVWLTFENMIAKEKKSNIIAFEHAVGIANRSGIFEQSEIYQAISFLHDLGIVQHFSNEYLKNKVVINPQWIVDVMACVVSVKNKVIHEGKLHHSDLAKIWEAYPTGLHSWLLRLTEEFDLTFPLQNEPLNLVPCLLPEKKPEFEWTDLERGSDIKENKMVYKFDYLPVGLFNRGQVRLHHLSDSGCIWKKGSFLRKNVHVALIQQTRDSELIVTAQGPRPENILFLIHEVFEGLIAESFNGVTYDFSMPCPECQKMMVKDHHMFDASTIRRAIDMKAPFLQCIKYFHTISCSDLQTLLPPDSHSDFDAHLVYVVQGLKDLRKDLTADIFISYCDKDNILDNSSYIVPSDVHTDLVDKGYKCWYKDKSDSQTTDDMAKSLIDSSVFLAFVSMNYAQDEDCINIFKYARLTLKKAIVVVAIGDGFEWKQSKLGILLADEVFINMIKPKREFYTSKLEELLKALSGKTRVVADVMAKPAVFFSYTWVNSAQAVSLGTKEIPGALGYGDPRDLKSYLEKNGVSCWIDVERVGMNGLFDDIAEGLLSAKVVIVCVSDEYAASPTCQIEFRYAANTLKLPIVVAAVGSGGQWRATEVGLMSVYFPIVNFQEKTKGSKKKLLKYVQDKLGEPEDAEAVKDNKNKTNDGHKNLSYLELFELAQRKLLRQLVFYAENQDVGVYPRLFVVDFVSEKENDDIEQTDQDEKTDLESEKVEKRPYLLKRSTSNILPAYKLQRFCVYTLCEHDEGWHSVSEPLELPDDFGLTGLDTYSPYLARMTTIMKYNKKLLLNCLTMEEGESYIKWLEESPEATMSDYQQVYHAFREMVMAADTDSNMGNLMRCHMTNGKTIWLCKEHRDTMKVTCLSNQDTSSHHSNDQDEKMNDWLIAGLRAVDEESLKEEFHSLGIAPRPKTKHRIKQECKSSQKKAKKTAKKGKQSEADDNDDDMSSDDDGDTTTVPTVSKADVRPALAKDKTKSSKTDKKAVNFSGEVVEISTKTTDSGQPKKHRHRHKRQADNDGTDSPTQSSNQNASTSEDVPNKEESTANKSVSSKVSSNPLETSNAAFGFSGSSRGSSASSSAPPNVSAAAMQMSSSRRTRASQGGQSWYKQKGGAQGSRACVLS